jgi:hypothetical protein
MMMLVRLWHHYIGFLVAPSVLFFALTGSLQLFSLHEAHGDYHPPMLIEGLGSVHKDQVFRIRPPRPPAPPSRPILVNTAAAPAAAPDDPHGLPTPASPNASAAPHLDHDAPKLGTTLLKWWFLVVALGLVTSICLGLWIGFNHVRRRWVALALLALGAVIPVALVLV